MYCRYSQTYLTAHELGLQRVCDQLRYSCCLQDYVKDCMREALIAMSPNVHIPEQRLLSEFDRLVPGLLAVADDDAPFTVSPETQAQPRLAFEHNCK